MNRRKPPLTSRASYKEAGGNKSMRVVPCTGSVIHPACTVGGGTGSHVAATQQRSPHILAHRSGGRCGERCGADGWRHRRKCWRECETRCASCWTAKPAPRVQIAHAAASGGATRPESMRTGTGIHRVHYGHRRGHGHGHAHRWQHRRRDRHATHMDAVRRVPFRLQTVAHPSRGMPDLASVAPNVRTRLEVTF